MSNSAFRFVKKPIGIFCVLLFLALVGADILWLATDGTWKLFKSRPAKAAATDRAEIERMARARRAKIVNYIKPTVTPATGDVGGKYFGEAPDPKRTRHYYIAAEPEKWDYMPSG